MNKNKKYLTKEKYIRYINYFLNHLNDLEKLDFFYELAQHYYIKQ